jgi:alkaline phosphatase D
MDKWSGYPAARQRLIDTVTRNGLKNVVVLSGDVHSHWAADLPLRMSDPDGPSVAVELTSTSVSSGGDGSEFADYWTSIKPTHPHVHYHSNRRGYLACEVKPSLWQSDFMTLDTVTTQYGVMSRGARVVVEPGNPVLIDS